MYFYILLCIKLHVEIDLINKMFEMDYKKRITAEQALEHEFFDEVRNLKK